MSDKLPEDLLTLRLEHHRCFGPPNVAQAFIALDDENCVSSKDCMFAHVLVGSVLALDNLDPYLGFFLEFDEIAANILVSESARKQLDLGDDQEWRNNNEQRKSLKKLVAAAEDYLALLEAQRKKLLEK